MGATHAFPTHVPPQLGAALSTMTSLRSIRLDAGEYGTVIETEGVLPDGLQLEFNRGLRPIEALKSLESLAMVGGVTTTPLVVSSVRTCSVVSAVIPLTGFPAHRRRVGGGCWPAATDRDHRRGRGAGRAPTRHNDASGGPHHQQGHSGAAGTSLVAACRSKVTVLLPEITPALFFCCLYALTPLSLTLCVLILQVKLLPLPSLRRLHVLFITVTASTHVELEAVQADLLRASHLLMEPAVQHAAAAAASASSSSSLPDPPPPPLDIWAGLQLVAESVPGNDNDEVMHNGKQIGVGGLARSLQPLQHVLRTLCLQVGAGAGAGGTCMHGKRAWA